MVPHTKINYWLVVYLPLWKILVSWDSNSQYLESRNPLSSLKTLVPECCSKLQRTNSTSKIAKADKYCKMNNWKQARWHSCFNRWARLRPVVQAVGLAAKRKWSELRKWIFDILNPRVSESSAGWVNALVVNQGGALETLTQKETCCIDIHWLYCIQTWHVIGICQMKNMYKSKWRKLWIAWTRPAVLQSTLSAQDKSQSSVTAWLSSLKTLVPECCSKLQRTNSTSKIAKADKYCKMNNWKQARWHSCFNRWARLRPVVLPTFAPVPDVAPNSQPHPTHLLSPPTHGLWNCPVLMDHPSS